MVENSYTKKSGLSPGYVYAPYIIVETSPTPISTINSRYSTKTISSKYYSTIVFSFRKNKFYSFIKELDIKISNQSILD